MVRAQYYAYQVHKQDPAQLRNVASRLPDVPLLSATHHNVACSSATNGIGVDAVFCRSKMACRYGALAMRLAGTNRSAAVAKDLVVNYLGYWTDSGAYYYADIPFGHNLTKMARDHVSLSLRSISVLFACRAASAPDHLAFYVAGAATFSARVGIVCTTGTRAE
jgi:hypothetical protein